MLELIKHISNTYNLSKKGWEKLHKLIEVKEYNAKTTIVEIGKNTSHFYFLFSGIVRACTIVKGKEYNSFLFSKNNYFAAFPALISNQPSKTNIECLTNATIASCNYYDFIKLTEESLEFNILYRKILEGFFISGEKREIELITTYATQRYENLQKRIPNIDNLIAQKHIAAHLGITSVQLSRLRKDLHKQNN